MTKYNTAVTSKVLQKCTFSGLEYNTFTPCSSKFSSFNLDARISEAFFDRPKSRAKSFN